MKFWGWIAAGLAITAGLRMAGMSADAWLMPLCGCLAVLVSGLLGKRLFGPLVGGAVVFWLALHPAHIGSSVGPGFGGLTLLNAALLLLFLSHALTANRWLWWLLAAVAQGILLGIDRSAVLYLLAVNAGMVLILSSRGPKWLLAGGRRLLVAGLLALILWLPMEKLLDKGNVFSGGSAMRDLLTMDHLALLISGMPLQREAGEAVTSPVLADLWPGGWWIILLGLLALTGIAWIASKVIRRVEFPGIMMFAHIAALVMLLIASVLRGGGDFPVAYFMPMLGIVLACGWTVLWKTRRARWLAVILPLLILLLFQKPLRYQITGGGGAGATELPQESPAGE